MKGSPEPFNSHKKKQAMHYWQPFPTDLDIIFCSTQLHLVCLEFIPIHHHPSTTSFHVHTVYITITLGIIQMNWKGVKKYFIFLLASNTPVLKFTILLVLKHNHDSAWCVKIMVIVKFYWFVILHNFYL